MSAVRGAASVKSGTARPKTDPWRCMEPLFSFWWFLQNVSPSPSLVWYLLKISLFIFLFHSTLCTENRYVYLKYKPHSICLQPTHVYCMALPLGPWRLVIAKHHCCFQLLLLALTSPSKLQWLISGCHSWNPLHFQVLCISTCIPWVWEVFPACQQWQGNPKSSSLNMSFFPAIPNQSPLLPSSCFLSVYLCFWHNNTLPIWKTGCCVVGMTHGLTSEITQW